MTRNKTTGLGLDSLVRRHKVLSFAIESLQSNEQEILKFQTLHDNDDMLRLKKMVSLKV